MSPLLFLAIAIVVPLLGMIVLGVGARIKSQKVTDDETEPFRRRLESIAPADPDDTPSGTPGLVRTMRRLRGGNAAKHAPRSAVPVSGEAAPVSGKAARRSRRARAAGQPAPLTQTQTPPPASIRLVKRDYSVPLLPPLGADLDELPQPPESRPRSRRAIPRSPDTARRHDRVISPSQRRRPGS